MVGDDNYVKYMQQNQSVKGSTENRVHFDSHSKAKRLPLTTNAEGPRPAGGQRLQTQLPSDAKQRLEEMANINQPRKYSAPTRIPVAPSAGGMAPAAKAASNSALQNSGSKKNNDIVDPVQDLIANRFNYPPLAKSTSALPLPPKVGGNKEIARATLTARRDTVATVPATSMATTTATRPQNLAVKSMNMKNHELSSASSDKGGGVVGGGGVAGHQSAPQTIVGVNGGGSVSSSPVVATPPSFVASSDHLDPSRKVRPKSFWANWWRF